MSEEFDCCIIGAGIAGLMTGAALAKKGLKIIILEKTSKLGGRSACTEYKNGYLVDNGIHVIRYCKKSPTAKIFKKFLGEKLQLIELGDGKFFYEGRWYDYPLSAAAIQTTDFFTDKEKEKFMKILADEIIQGKSEPLLNTNVKKWLLDLEKKYELKSKGPRIFLETLAKFMLVSPGMLDKLSVGELKAGIQLGLKAGKGACYPKGSWKSLIGKLSNIIRTNGEIRTGSTVKKVIINNKKVEGVIYNDQKKIKSKIVVVNLPCTNIFSILDEKLFSKKFIDLCNGIIPSVGVSIDFGLKKKISEFNGSILSANPFTMSIFTSNIDPDVAPEGEQLYTIFQPTTIETIKDEKKSNEVIKNIEKLLEQMFPGFSNVISWKRAIKYQLVDAAIPLVTQHRNKRPNIQSKEIENLYFTGDSYNGPGTGGEIAHASAELCIQAILNDLNLS
ncbi:MAG: FAD-dependent oxidoreductase [Candidatus Lokiarchaeota archaeon]|nr:FAD-dependent oxidoreductase [Candidatus Lokiarchaeota archaeon]